MIVSKKAFRKLDKNVKAAVLTAAKTAEERGWQMSKKDLLHFSPYALLAALTLFFIVLGCFLDGISVVVLTTSVIMQMVEQAGIDPLWFGIFVVIVVERCLTRVRWTNAVFSAAMSMWLTSRL